MLDSSYKPNRMRIDRGRSVFILIALAGILPSTLVLWFASLAVRNEQLATAKVEEEAQQVLLNQIKTNLLQSWNTQLGKVDQLVASLPPAAAFHEAVTAVGTDGLIILANDTHSVLYPGLPSRANESRDLDAQLASQFAVLTTAIQRGQKGKAERAAQSILSNADFDRCVDQNGRHTLSSIELLILENQNVIGDAAHAAALSRLTSRLNNYRFDLIPASQRRFLMSRVAELTSSAAAFPTMSAELLSAQFRETNSEQIADSNLNRSKVSGVWQQRLPSGNGVALFTEQRMQKLFGDWLAAMDNRLKPRVHVEIAPDALSNPYGDTAIPLGDAFPGWRLRIASPNAGEDNPSLAGMYVALSVAAIGLTLLILFVLASITLRRLALAQQKNTMVATVSHELKTPVSSIKVLVDTLLQDKVLRLDRVREYLDLIARENLRLSQLIENFLSFSRIERTKFKIERQPINVSELIREAVTTFSRQVDITDGELTVDIAPGNPPYRGDAWALNRVLLNLLDNAYKFSDPPRHIHVSMGVEHQSLVITVSDNGIGIREADLGKIFDQFYQADQKLSRSNEGCGLGLSIVRHIVNLHDGTVDVASKPGEGSTFTVRLPFEQQ
jgi:signal transduction histidine kinase